MKENKLVSLSLGSQKRPLFDLLVTEKVHVELSVIDNNCILGCVESSCNSYTVKPRINNYRIY